MKRLLLIYLSIVAVLSEETDIEKFAASSNDFTASLYNVGILRRIFKKKLQIFCRNY